MTDVSEPAPTRLTRARLGLLVAGASVAAAIVVVGYVLPAEFQIDPTGFGKATGLIQLGTPQPASAKQVVVDTTAPVHRYAMPFRSDTVDIPLAAGGDPMRGDEVEYKVRMAAGDSLVYSWSVDGVPNDEEFYYDFHGETPAGPGGKPAAVVVEYAQLTGRKANGSLVAPIPGVHGWYLQNQSAKPVVVKLRVSGFYTLVPPGDYGNTAGIIAKAVPTG